MPLTENERLRDRLDITGLDLGQAGVYLGILERRAHTAPMPENYHQRPDWFEEKLVREVIFMAALICYAKPFSDLKDREGLSEPAYLRWVVDELSAEDCALHNWILAAWNQFLAHSDARHYARVPFGDVELFGGADGDVDLRSRARCSAALSSLSWTRSRRSSATG